MRASSWLGLIWMGALALLGTAGCAGSGIGLGDGGLDDGGQPVASGDSGTLDGGGDGGRQATAADVGARDGGGWHSASAGVRCDGITAVLRDFRKTHPDFGRFSGNGVQGLVAANLDAERKPVHANSGPTAATTGPESFRQWYRDVPGVNLRQSIDLPLTQRDGGHFVFDDADFFPLDGLGFGAEGDGRNYFFTTEIHTAFTYLGGERFTFRGDDDVWIFVNGRLVVDLGGPHPPLQATIDFDARAAELGLARGRSYALDVFHAERQYTESNFRIETSIPCFQAPELN